LISQKNYSAASAEIKRAFELNAEDAEAWYFKGILFGYEKKVKEAIDSLKKSLERAPDHAYAHYQIGLAYYQIKRPDLTIVHFNRFLELAPEAPEAPQVRNLLNFLRR
jgi:tetratricopeptide (TPR) repeat protein